VGSEKLAIDNEQINNYSKTADSEYHSESIAVDKLKTGR